jgi:repressor of nif and glnA expression
VKNAPFYPLIDGKRQYCRIKLEGIAEKKIFFAKYNGHFTAIIILKSLKIRRHPGNGVYCTMSGTPIYNSGKDHTVSGRSSRARMAILKALEELGETAGASRISEMLQGTGIDLQERTIRFHLHKMDHDGLTRFVAKHSGRLITDNGRRELARQTVMHKVGFAASRMDEFGYRMSFNPETITGTVVANLTLINKRDVSRALHFMKPVFASGLTMGDRIAIRMWGDTTGVGMVPRGKIGIATICSVTINGVFLKAGIPVVSRFGGLVEMENGTPKRFIELIEYQGTSVDPHKLFINAGLTSVGKYSETGSGVICVSFREFPSAAIETARKLVAQMHRANCHGVLAVGTPTRTLLDIPVGDGRTGMITIDGLNPMAALHEAGIPLEMRPLSGLEDIKTFVPFGDIAPMGQRSNYVE